MPQSTLSPSQSRYLLPSWRHWLVLTAALVALLLAINIASPSNAFRIWYWMRVVGPAQEARFGFRAALDNRGYGVRIITVTENGAFHAAGVRPGWLSRQPTCFGYSQAELLFSSLEDATAGTRVPLRFVPAEQSLHPTPRWVVIPTPQHSAPPAG